MLPGRSAAPWAVERIEDARQADERVLDHLVRLGCDLSVPREIRHFLYLPAPGDAEQVSHSLHADGWSTSVEVSEEAWLVVASSARTLSPAFVRETRVRLASLAAAHAGVYDGWEVPLTR